MQELHSWNPSEVTEDCDSNNSWRKHHCSLNLGMKFKYLKYNLFILSLIYVGLFSCVLFPNTHFSYDTFPCCFFFFWFSINIHKFREVFPIDLHFFIITGVYSSHYVFTARKINIYNKKILKEWLKKVKSNVYKIHNANARKKIFHFENILHILLHLLLLILCKYYIDFFVKHKDNLIINNFS